MVLDPDLHQQSDSISTARKSSLPLRRNGSTSSIRHRFRDDSLCEEEDRRKEEPKLESYRGDIIITTSFLLPRGPNQNKHVRQNLPNSNNDFSQNKKNISAKAKNHINNASDIYCLAS